MLRSKSLDGELGKDGVKVVGFCDDFLCPSSNITLTKTMKEQLYSADLMVFAFSALILAGYGNQGIMGNLTLRMYAMALLSNAADFTNLQNNYL